MLNRLGGHGQDNVVGLSRTQFLADVGFKPEELFRSRERAAGSCYRAA